MGTNYVTAALLAGVLLTILLRTEAGRRPPWLVLTALGLACLGITLAAPGNAHRLALVQAPQLAPGQQVVLAVARAGVASSSTSGKRPWHGRPRAKVKLSTKSDLISRC